MGSSNPIWGFFFTAILRLYEATFMPSAWNCQTHIKNSVHTVTQLPPPEAAPTDVQGYIHRKDVYNVHRWNLNSQMFKDAHRTDVKCMLYHEEYACVHEECCIGKPHGTIWRCVTLKMRAAMWWPVGRQLQGLPIQ